MNKVKITIVGAGYVGMSLAVLLAKHHEIDQFADQENEEEENLQDFINENR